MSDSTVVEPLISNWAIWSDLVSPTSYSMHLTYYQLGLLASYLNDPELHIKASRNPRLAGGRFVNIPVERASEVRMLIEETKQGQRDNISFAEALVAFYQYLSEEAKGQSIEPFYAQLPEALRGYVELAYDYYGHPIIRVLESLLYESPYYKKQLQSLRVFKYLRDDERPDFLNTPRLKVDDQIDWLIPFESPRIDELFKLDLKAQPFDRILDNLDLSGKDMHNLLPLLSEGGYPLPQKWNARTVRLRYLGHACVLIEWKGISILTDPFLGAIPAEEGIERYSYKDLPERIDFALITHGHHDHFVLESLLRLRHRINCLVVARNFGVFHSDPSLRLMSRKLGFKNVIEMDSLDTIALPDGEIIAIPFLGEHADLIHGKTAYAIRAGKQIMLFAADSNCLDKKMYTHIRNLLGPIETVFLGMECVGAPLSWLYGALMPTKLQRSYDQSRRTKGCDSGAALDLMEAIGATRVYIYAMGCEPWLRFSMGFGLSEDSAQIKESDRVLAKAREKGFLHAQRPFGKAEVYLDGC
ncbi:MAG: MBL fold metallo-hydrolase [Nitrososphaera sp.]